MILQRLDETFETYLLGLNLHSSLKSGTFGSKTYLFTTIPTPWSFNTTLDNTI